jgi:predicted SAM-dependent methyltransferase
MSQALPNRRLKRDRYPYRWLLQLAPLHAIQVVRYELKMAWVRATHRRTDRRFVAGDAIMLNVGCGRNGKDGWVNVDSATAPGVTCIYDCRRRIPLRTGTAKVLFTEHLVEHLDYAEEAPRFLSECRRVLEPGGVLRIVVPDGRKYLLAYAEGGWGGLMAFSPLLAGEVNGFRTPMEVVNAHFRQAGQHRFSYDFDTMRLMLERSGFGEVRESSYGSSRFDGLAIDDERRSSESLYVEAISTAPSSNSA